MIIICNDRDAPCITPKVKTAPCITPKVKTAPCITPKVKTAPCITPKVKTAPCITPKVKTAIRRNSRVYRKWVKRGEKVNDVDQVQDQKMTHKYIIEAKQLCHKKLGEKLTDLHNWAK